MKRCLCLDVMQCVGSLLFVSSKWKFKYRFLLPLQEAQAALQKKKKKINLPNSNYKEHILGTCIIQSISVHNEHAQVGGFVFF